MSRTRDTLCDRCGQPIATLAEALVASVFDELGRAIGIGVYHAPCVASARDELDRLHPDQSLVDQPARNLLRDSDVASLRRLARSHTARASRVLAKVKRLALQHARVDTAPDPDPAPVLRPCCPPPPPEEVRRWGRPDGANWHAPEKAR